VIDLALRLQRPGFTLEVALALPARGVSVLFGPSGCGKTTLLRCLAGLERVPGARIAIDGQPWQDGPHFVPPHRRGVGYVFQEASLFPHLDVRGNLEYGLRRAGDRASAATLQAAVELLGIGALLGRRTQGLSGGERQRVAVARALAAGPRLLLLDEPLAALDAARKAEVLPFLGRLQRELTVPVVYVTHAMAELLQLADHVVTLDAGRVTGSGPLQEMLSRLSPALAADEAAAVVLPCTVAERDTRWHLAALDFDGGRLWVRDAGHAVGERLRVQIAARDVSLALHRLADSSVTNQYAGTLQALVPDVHPAHALALVRVGGVLLMSRLTHRSADRLGLAAGRPVWALIRSVSPLP
jgi:molybdate transport system ATP-binding protein